MDLDETSGRISLDGDTIEYVSDFFESWKLPVDRLRVIGESTNQLGPYLDDYFLCFATGVGAWRQASFYAEGLQEFLDAPSKRLECEIRLTLMSFTDFASNVMWPPHLAGRPMFQFVYNKLPGLLGRLADRLFGAASNTQTYTDEIRLYLESSGSE